MLCSFTETWTQIIQIKSLVLYQLSYEGFFFSYFSDQALVIPAEANIPATDAGDMPVYWGVRWDLNPYPLDSQSRLLTN